MVYHLLNPAPPFIHIQEISSHILACKANKILSSLFTTWYILLRNGHLIISYKVLALLLMLSDHGCSAFTTSMTPAERRIISLVVSRLVKRSLFHSSPQASATDLQYWQT